MRARRCLIVSSLILASCGSDDPIVDDTPLHFDASPVTTRDSGSQGSDAGQFDSGSSPSSDAGARPDAGSTGMDASTAAGGNDASVADATAMDGAARDAAADGASADTGAGSAAIAMLGATCTTALDKACTGNNAADKLVCVDGKWARNGSCDTDARCETQKGPSQGLCVSVATGCAGKAPGATVCNGMTVKTCGPDLIDLKLTTTCTANAHCEDGNPASCKCDTGYTTGDAGAAACVNANDCADNPCGTDNSCTDAVSDYTCTCANTYWQASTKRCASKFKSVATGDGRTCALRNDGTVACWGLGMDGTDSQPQTIAGLTTVKQITVGRTHACALKNDNTVSCWGTNDQGQLGNGTRTDSLRTPVAVSTLNNVVQVAAGDGFTCAVWNRLFGPALSCWGDNRVGQLGNNSTSAFSATPVTVNGTFGSVALGTGHACAVRDDNTAFCWGNNTSGELGNNSMTLARAPVAVTNALGSGVTELALGADFSCARKSGTVYCWGAVLGADGNVLVPTLVPNLTDAAQISAAAGGTHVCVRKTGNTVVCWGENGDGRLGNGDTAASAVPVAAGNGLTNVAQVAAGVAHTCAWKGATDGNIVCWGQGTHGELGNAMKSSSLQSVQVKGF